MPSKQIRRIFVGTFYTEQISEDTSFNLISGSVDDLKARCKDRRGLARMLASAESYGGQYFDSMAKHFGVSIEAMAIRLEELKLLEI